MANHIVPDEYLTVIGDITVSFNHLESHLRTVIGSLINERAGIAQIITAELSFKACRALLISLYLEKYEKDDDYMRLRSYMQRATVLEDRRNQIAHSIWGAAQGEAITRIKITAKEKHGIRPHFETVDIDSLKETIGELNALSQELLNFYIKGINDEKLYNNPF